MHTGCIPQEKQLSLYIDERLDKTAQETFEAHLASCDECRSAVDAIQTLRASTALRPAPQAPAFLMDRVMAEIQRQSQAQTEAQPQEATPPMGLGGWLQGLLPSLRIAAPISSGIAACLLIWSFTNTPTPAPQAKAKVAQSAASAPSTSEQMLFGEDTTSTNSTKQLVRDIWDVDDDATTTRGG